MLIMKFCLPFCLQKRFMQSIHRHILSSMEIWHIGKDKEMSVGSRNTEGIELWGLDKGGG